MSLSRSTLTQLTKVCWTDLRKTGESIGSILLAKAAKDDVEDVVFGARAQSGFVQGATHQLTVVHHNNCNKHMRTTTVKHMRCCSWGLNNLTVCMTLCSHSLLAATTGPNAHTSIKHARCCPCSLTILLSVWHYAVTDCSVCWPLPTRYWLPQLDQMHTITQTHEMLLTAVNMTKIRHCILATTTGPNTHTHTSLKHTRYC